MITLAPMNLTSSAHDGELLAAFATRQDEAAFAEIVRRHGGVVLSVCRSVLGNSQDAEDASQAVFLTLAQKASSLTGRKVIIGWLYLVARHISVRAIKARAVRTRYEQEAAHMKSQTLPGDPRPEPDEVIPPALLHDALAALPEKYRIAILLHHLEGKSEQETASLIGCGVSATSSRLSRGRAMLRQKLLGRGMVLSTIGVAAIVGSEASAAVPPAFVHSASQAAVALVAGKSATLTASPAAVALSKGALKMLFWTKVKMVAMVATGILLIGGAGVVSQVTAKSKSTPAKDAGPTTQVHANPDSPVENENEPRAANDPKDDVTGVHAALDINKATWPLNVPADKPMRMSLTLRTTNVSNHDLQFSYWGHKPSDLELIDAAGKVVEFRTERPVASNKTNESSAVSPFTGKQGLLNFGGKTKGWKNSFETMSPNMGLIHEISLEFAEGRLIWRTAEATYYWPAIPREKLPAGAYQLKANYKVDTFTIKPTVPITITADSPTPPAH